MAANGGECSDQSLKLSATTCSDQSVARSPRRPSIETRVCLVGAAAHNETLIQALKVSYDYYIIKFSSYTFYKL